MKSRIIPRTNLIVCDECKGEFFLEAVDIVEYPVSNLPGINLVYFCCPYCGKIYKISIKDTKMKQLITDLNQVAERIKNLKGIKDKALAESLQSIYEAKSQRLKEYSTKLLEKYSGDFTFESLEWELGNPKFKKSKELIYHKNMEEK